MQTMKTKYWTMIETTYTGTSGPKQAQSAVYDKIIEAVDIEEVPDVSLSGMTDEPVRLLTATIAADTPLEALGFLMGTLRTAVEASGQTESWDLAGAVLRVAPVREAHRTYEPVDDDSPRCLPHGDVGGRYGHD
jgi:hypothetical protein